MKRVSVRVPLERAEEARAAWLERFPQGFEEHELERSLELAAYVAEVPDDLRDADVADVRDDWEERWREFHRPVIVGQLWIGPPWERPPRRLVPVFIDPGRAFGTGAHPTTRLCIEWLVELERASLLDVGCGSGVVAIAAAKLGYEPVFAVDDDEAAVEATERNARANGVALTSERADALQDPLPDTELTVANIAARTVATLAPRLRSRLLVTSGYGLEAAPELDGFRRVGRRIEDEWVADLWQRRQ